MARPIWNGTISFGLLNVPVQLFSGDRSIDVHFRMLDSRDKKPIRYERVNSETGEEVPWKEIVKAFEYEKGSYVVIDEDEIRKAAPEATETVEIETFVEREAVSPIYFEKPYYLVPGKKAEKGYVLLRETLKKSGKIGIAKVVIRTRQYLAALMPCGDALMLDLMRFPQELVSADEFNLPTGSAADHRVTPKEIEMATALVDSMTTPWKSSDYADDFRARLRQIIDLQIVRETGKKIKEFPEEIHETGPAATNVVDFMALLKKSLASKGKEGRGSATASKRSPTRARKKATTTKRKAS